MQVTYTHFCLDKSPLFPISLESVEKSSVEVDQEGLQAKAPTHSSWLDGQFLHVRVLLLLCKYLCAHIEKYATKYNRMRTLCLFSLSIPNDF